jgi:hypothetical protein
MSSLNTSLDTKTIENMGIYQAATLDGYWENAARDDLQYIFLLGQLRATKSLNGSYGNHAIRNRIKRLTSEIQEIEKRLVS